ncbi:MAG: WG repeat-containing protein [Oscillospiraceae bacterium]|nr:WG repeat-containing protein [Oscillospiraceae bacterium]
MIRMKKTLSIALAMLLAFSLAVVLPSSAEDTGKFATSDPDFKPAGIGFGTYFKPTAAGLTNKDVVEGTAGLNSDMIKVELDNGRYSFYNLQTNTLLSAAGWKDAGDFNNGWAAVRLDEDAVVTITIGDEVFDEEYDRWTYIDTNGNELVPFGYADDGFYSVDMQAFVGGYARVQFDPKWVETPRPGQSSFWDRRDGNWTFIDQDGNIINKDGWAETWNFSEGYAVVGTVSGSSSNRITRYKFIDGEGTALQGVSTSYLSAESFKNGLAKVQRSENNNYSYIYVNEEGRGAQIGSAADVNGYRMVGGGFFGNDNIGEWLRVQLPEGQYTYVKRDGTRYGSTGKADQTVANTWAASTNTNEGYKDLVGPGILAGGENTIGASVSVRFSSPTGSVPKKPAEGAEGPTYYLYVRMKGDVSGANVHLTIGNGGRQLLSDLVMADGSKSKRLATDFQDYLIDLSDSGVTQFATGSSAVHFGMNRLTSNVYVDKIVYTTNKDFNNDTALGETDILVADTWDGSDKIANITNGEVNDGVLSMGVPAPVTFNLKVIPATNHKYAYFVLSGFKEDAVFDLSIGQKADGTVNRKPLTEWIMADGTTAPKLTIDRQAYLFDLEANGTVQFGYAGVKDFGIYDVTDTVAVGRILLTDNVFATGWKNALDIDGDLELMPVQAEDGRWNYRAFADGKMLSQTGWAEVSSFSGGRAAVKLDSGNWSIIKSDGSLVDPTGWYSVEDVQAKNALVRVEAKEGMFDVLRYTYLDANNKPMNGVSWTDATPMKNGYAYGVASDGSYRVVSEDHGLMPGSFSKKPTYFNDKFVIAEQSGAVTLTNPAGFPLADQKFVSLVALKNGGKDAFWYLDKNGKMGILEMAAAAKVGVTDGSNRNLDINDVRILLQSLVGKIEWQAAAVAGVRVIDNPSITITNARFMLQRLVDKIDKFPIE